MTLKTRLRAGTPPSRQGGGGDDVPYSTVHHPRACTFACELLCE